MDTSTAYQEALRAARSAVLTALAMLPSELWGDEADAFERDTVRRLEGALYELEIEAKNGPSPRMRRAQHCG